MSQNAISCEVNKGTCEAFACFAEATTEIAVKVGQQGLIKLFVCESCKTKFID